MVRARYVICGFLVLACACGKKVEHKNNPFDQPVIDTTKLYQLNETQTGGTPSVLPGIYVLSSTNKDLPDTRDVIRISIVDYQFVIAKDCLIKEKSMSRAIGAVPMLFEQKIGVIHLLKGVTVGDDWCKVTIPEGDATYTFLEDGKTMRLTFPGESTYLELKKIADPGSVKKDPTPAPAK